MGQEMIECVHGVPLDTDCDSCGELSARHKGPGGNVDANSGRATPPSGPPTMWGPKVNIDDTTPPQDVIDRLELHIDMLNARIVELEGVLRDIAKMGDKFDCMAAANRALKNDVGN